MKINVQTAAQCFSFSLSSGTWTYQTLSYPRLCLHCAPFSLHYNHHHRTQRWVINQAPETVSSVEEITTPHGAAKRLTLIWRRVEEALTLLLEVVLLESAPLLLWRFHLTNSGGDAIRLIEAAVLTLIEEQSQIPLVFESDSPKHTETDHSWAVFVDGWQSWNYAGVLGVQDRMSRSRLGGLVRPMRYLAGSPRPRLPGHTLSDMFAVLGHRGKRQGMLMGFLSQAQAFGQIALQIEQAAPRGRMWLHLDNALLPAGHTFCSDWACVQPVDLDSDVPLAPYLDAAGVENKARVDRDVPIGWCSWYYAFNNVMAEDVLGAAEIAGDLQAEIPLRLIQLDDGFESAVGDWFETKPGFPEGLAALPEQIHASGFRAGLWLAPLTASRRSKLARAHPDWVLRNRCGFASNPGFIFNSFPFALDPTHPEVLEHCQGLMRSAREWGYDYLKLDFLYAGALPGKRFDPTKTRAQALRKVLECMRQTAGDEIFLLGCGCPLGSGVGIFDAMRINPDVAPRWYPSHFGIEALLRDEEGLPSARNAILTTINRLPMHRRWWINDPDCLLIRDKMTDLTPAEVQTLATVIALSAGSILDSDPLLELSQERKQWLARLLPPLPEAARAVDWFDHEFPQLLTLPLHGPQGNWQLMAVINWSDEPQARSMRLDALDLASDVEYHVMDFWREKYFLHQGPILRLEDIPPHGVRVLGLRRRQAGVQWIGDSMHISQGLGVTRWDVQPGRVKIGMDLGRKAEGRIMMQLPSPISHAEARSGPCTWKKHHEEVYAIDLSIEKDDTLILEMVE